MDKIWMTHPNLPGRKVQVPASSFHQRRRAGWEETDPPPPPEIPKPKSRTSAPAPAGASSLPDKESPKARRIKGDE